MGDLQYRLGIDVGTSNTVAAVTDASGRTTPLLFDSSPLLASAVFAAPDGTLLVGQDAERAAAGNPGGLERNPKRRIDEGTVWLADRAVAVPDLLAALLRRVAVEAGRVTGGAPQEVVLTHPAAWGQVRIATLADAAARGGLGRVRFTPEPAAAAAYFAGAAPQRLAAGRCLIVYDFGAGTFDATVLRAEAHGFTVLASGGLDDVGGLDLDAAVVGHARGLTQPGAPDAWQRLDWPQNAADQWARQQLWSGAKAVKEQLSRHPSAELHVPLLDSRVTLTREEFERLILPRIESTAVATLSVVHEAGITPELVDGVFLVGGSSRLPLAATVLHRTLKIAPTVLDQPELVVAIGSIFTPAAPAPAAPPVSGFPAVPLIGGQPATSTQPAAPGPLYPPGSPATSTGPSPFGSPVASAPPFQGGSPVVSGPSFQGGLPVASGPPFQGGLPVASGPPFQGGAPVASGPAPKRSRRRAWVLTAAGVVLTLVAAAVVAVWQFGGTAGSDEAGTEPWEFNGIGKLLFEDQFAGGANPLWQKTAGVWQASGNEWCGNGDVLGWQTATVMVSNIKGEAVHFHAAPDAGVTVEAMLHLLNGHYVGAYLSTKDNVIGIADSKPSARGGAQAGTPVKTVKYTFHAGQQLDVWVVAKGNDYMIALNGRKVLSYTDTKGTLSAAGETGFAADGGGICFSDVKLYDVDS